MPKKAIALALSITAIIFCVTNIDRRASADYDANVTDAESANIEVELQAPAETDDGEQLAVLDAAPKTIQPSNSSKTAGMDFSLKRLIVQTNDYDALTKYGAKITKLLKGFYALEFASEDATRNAFLELSDLESVKAVDPDMNIKLSSVAPSQYAWGVENIGADHYTDWLKISENNTTVKISVIDSGINKNHMAFLNENNVNDRIVITPSTKDYVNNDADPDDENGHGTSVAGVIVESTPSNVKVYPSKIFDSTGKTQGVTDLLEAITNAVNEDEVDIINLSLGFDAENESDIIKCSDYSALENFFAAVKNAGTLVIAAAGNEAHAVSFPANCSDVVAVSSVKSDRTFSSDFSNYGPEIEFAMPGEDLYLPSIIKAGETVPDPSINSNNAIRLISGTSFSSPFLAAAAALIKADNATYTPAQIVTALKSYAVPLGAANKFGNGIVDFGAKLFDTPRVYASSTGADWVKTGTVKIGAVSSSPITGIAAKSGSATPSTSDWRSEGIPSNLNTIPLTDVSVDNNGTYGIWVKNNAAKIGSTTVTVSNVDNTAPGFGSQITFSDAGEDKITINASVRDSQSGLKKVTLYYRKKGTTNYSTKTTNYSSTTAQTTLSFTLTGLEDTTEYEFYITAEDALGNSSSTTLSTFTTQTTAPIQLPDAGGEQGSETPANPEPEAVTTSATNPVTVDPILIYFSGFVGSTMLGFAIYRTIGGRR